MSDRDSRPTLLESVDHRVDPAIPPPSNLVAAERYENQGVLGEGGMGVVHLVHDRQIGRSVAYKTLRAAHRLHPSAVSRFLREARVQAREPDARRLR